MLFPVVSLGKPQAPSASQNNIAFFSPLQDKLLTTSSSIPTDTRREADDHKCPEERCWEVRVRRHKHGWRT